MNLMQIFKPKYLLDPTPGSDFAYFWPLLIAGAIIFLCTFLVKAKHANNNWPARLREWSLLFLLVVFFRDQNIPYLGSRIAIVLVTLGTVIYGIWTWRREQDHTRIHKEYSALRNARKARKADPYLPKKKRK